MTASHIHLSFILRISKRSVEKYGKKKQQKKTTTNTGKQMHMRLNTIMQLVIRNIVIDIKYNVVLRSYA